MEIITGRPEIDDVPYGKFSVKVPVTYTWIRKEYSGFWRGIEFIPESGDRWDFLDEDGERVGAYSKPRIEFFSREEAQKFIEWYENRMNSNAQQPKAAQSQ